MSRSRLVSIAIGTRKKKTQKEPPAVASTSTAEVPQSSLPTNKCAGKAIMPGRWINFTFLLQKGFKIGELMKRMS